MNYKEKFSEFVRPSFFSRVDTEHVLNWHVGIDELGRKSIEYRSNFTARKVTGTKYIAVNQYKNKDYNTIRFSLCDKSLDELFYKFCDDMVEKTRCLKDPLLGYNAVIERFALWKKMFVQGKSTILSEEGIMGLIGELVFQRNYLFKRFGIAETIKGWSGQDLTRKDFSYGEEWYEVKAVAYNKDSVFISSLEQLDSTTTGELAVVLLEKMSPSFWGTTLNQLIFDIVDKIEDVEARELFWSKIELSGYTYNAAYDDFVYAVKSIKRYKVDDSYPHLTPNNVPCGVVSAKYEISFLAIKDKELE